MYKNNRGCLGCFFNKKSMSEPQAHGAMMNYGCGSRGNTVCALCSPAETAQNRTLKYFLYKKEK